MGVLIEKVNIIGVKYDFSNDYEVINSKKELDKICLCLNKTYENSLTFEEYQEYQESYYLSFLEEEVLLENNIQLSYWGNADMRSSYGYGIILSSDYDNTLLNKLLLEVNSTKVISNHQEISIC